MVRFIEMFDKYNYSWDQVVRAFWCRYPNPYSNHVLTEDTVERYVDNEGRLISKRLICKTSRPPGWAERFVPSRICYILEESMVDPVNKVFETNTRNIGMQTIMTVDENVVYRPANDNPNTTISERKAWIDSNMYGLSKAVQAVGTERFKHGCTKAAKGLQLVLDAMYSNGENTIDTNNTILHPLLMEKLKEKALSIKEKAKLKGVPLVTVAACTQNQ